MEQIKEMSEELRRSQSQYNYEKEAADEKANKFKKS